MSKDFTVCFRTSDVLRKPLEEVARRERRSLSAVVERILVDYVSRGLHVVSGNERRRHPRREVFLPAFIVAADGEGRHPAVVRDLSLDGIRFVLPEGENGFAERTAIDVVFALPGQKSAVNASCEACRIKDGNGEIEVGAAFSECNPSNYEKIQRFLMS